MCRHVIDKEQCESENFGKVQWSLIDIDNEEYMNECNTLFFNTFSDFIGNN
jgi:hypothetical protein